jgi:hypothetical protein
MFLVITATYDDTTYECLPHNEVIAYLPKRDTDKFQSFAWEPGQWMLWDMGWVVCVHKDGKR